MMMVQSAQRATLLYRIVKTALLAVVLASTMLDWHTSYDRPPGAHGSVAECLASGGLVVERICDGWDHLSYGPDWLLALSVALHLASILLRNRPRLAGWLGLASSAVVIGVLLFIEDLWLGVGHPHIADHVETAPGQILFLLACTAFVVAPAASFVGQRLVLPILAQPAGDGFFPRERKLAVLGAALADLLVLAAFAPWHTVSAVGLPLACVFGPDCRPSSTAGPPQECTAFDHVGPAWLPLLLLGIALGIAIVVVRRVNARRVLALSAFGVALLVNGMAAWALLFGGLTHLLDPTTPLYGDVVFSAVALSWQGVVTLQAFAFLRGRRLVRSPTP